MKPPFLLIGIGALGLLLIGKAAFGSPVSPTFNPDPPPGFGSTTTGIEFGVYEDPRWDGADFSLKSPDVKRSAEPRDPSPVFYTSVFQTFGDSSDVYMGQTLDLQTDPSLSSLPVRGPVPPMATAASVPVPEPSTLIMLVLGLGGMAILGKKTGIRRNGGDPRR